MKRINRPVVSIPRQDIPQSRRRSARITGSSTCKNIRATKDWKDRFFCFRKEKPFNDTTPRGSYSTCKSNKWKVSSSTDIMRQARGIQSFLSSMNKSRSVRKGRSKETNISMPKTKEKGSLVTEEHQRKASDKRSIKVRNILRSKLTYEQNNIIQAVIKNNFTYLKRVRDKRDQKDFSVHDKKGNCALYYAIKEDCYEAAEYLINKIGCDVNAKNENGNTCLHQAMMRDNIDIILLLLKSGANPEAFNKFNETPIFYASNRVLSKFGLRNKKACLLKDFKGFPSKEKQQNHKRIRVNLRPKRNDKQKRIHQLQIEREKSQELKDLQNHLIKIMPTVTESKVGRHYSQVSPSDVQGINLKFTPQNKRNELKEKPKTLKKKKTIKRTLISRAISKTARRGPEPLGGPNHGDFSSLCPNERYAIKDSSPLYPQEVYFDI
ncbi:unnamed protein product [Moneuplotes crassus]|uniref:Uncharacterized protein n=2 Tax=Euplotes crassus TaxID=5936 RepID=A0AAD1UG06_EUPCR|nr:unnamed protein product [Moneuplotes crassus]